MNCPEDPNNIKAIIQNKQLFCLEIDLKGECNQDCSFCYLTNSNSHDKAIEKKELSFNEIIDLISQAHKLGAKKLILYTSKSNQHPFIKKISKFIDERNLQMDCSLNKSINTLPSDSVIIKCLKHKYSCFITLDGSVFPCAGMPLLIGNIRNNTLKKILSDSEVVENLRNHEINIKGPCRKCNKFSECYGCRARAFSITGDYLGSDPLCPENQSKLDKITYLPMSVENLIPQKQGMRIVSTLLKIGERTAKVESVFTDQNLFVKPDGSVEEIAYMEMMAQAAAVMNGFEKFDTDRPDPGGFLIGGQKINIYCKAYIKEKLIIDIFKETKFGNFGILTATIKRDNDLIAEGEIKIYENDGENNEI